MSLALTVLRAAAELPGEWTRLARNVRDADPSWAAKVVTLAALVLESRTLRARHTPWSEAHPPSPCTRIARAPRRSRGRRRERGRGGAGGPLPARPDRRRRRGARLADVIEELQRFLARPPVEPTHAKRDERDVDRHRGQAAEVRRSRQGCSRGDSSQRRLLADNRDRDPEVLSSDHRGGALSAATSRARL